MAAVTQDELVAAGQLGGRTVHITEGGEVECVCLPDRRAGQRQVRVRTLRSAVSPGTEMTFLGRAATNVYLHRRGTAACASSSRASPAWRTR